MAKSNTILILAVAAGIYFLSKSTDTAAGASGSGALPFQTPSASNNPPPANNPTNVPTGTGYTQYNTYNWPSAPTGTSADPIPVNYASPTPTAKAIEVAKATGNTAPEIQHAVNIYAGVPALVAAAAYYNTPKTDYTKQTPEVKSTQASGAVSYLKDAPKLTAFEQKYGANVTSTTYKNGVAVKTVSGYA